MFKYVPRTMSIKEKIDLENAMRVNAQNAANIDYIAMMTDVEIPTEEADENAQPEV